MSGPGEKDDPDARAFSPLAKGIEAYLEAEERGEIKPPTFHYAPHGSYAPACGERVGFVRDHPYAVTCEACKAIAEADEKRHAAKLAKAKERRKARRTGT